MSVCDNSRTATPTTLGPSDTLHGPYFFLPLRRKHEREHGSAHGDSTPALSPSHSADSSAESTPTTSADSYASVDSTVCPSYDEGQDPPFLGPDEAIRSIESYFADSGKTASDIESLRAGVRLAISSEDDSPRGPGQEGTSTALKMPGSETEISLSCPEWMAELYVNALRKQIQSEAEMSRDSTNETMLA